MIVKNGYCQAYCQFGNHMILNTTWIALRKRMESLGILENDLSESFILSSKKGGQNVNKNSTCVQLKHLPSGLEVKSQGSRSQEENRYYARKILCEKMEVLLLGKKSPKLLKAAKIKKQKKRREKKSQAKHSGE